MELGRITDPLNRHQKEKLQKCRQNMVLREFGSKQIVPADHYRSGRMGLQCQQMETKLERCIRSWGLATGKVSNRQMMNFRDVAACNKSCRLRFKNWILISTKLEGSSRTPIPKQCQKELKEPITGTSQKDQSERIFCRARVSSKKDQHRD